MDNNSEKSEPQRMDGWSVESEYSIEHPLIVNQSFPLKNTRAMDLFIESVKCIQEGNEIKGATLFQEAEKEDPLLHTHARDALLTLTHGCTPEAEGAVYYWLGIHSQYLKENDQAIMWYGKAVEAFRRLGYKMREGRALCNLGTAKMQVEDQSGMEDYQKAVELNPSDGIAHICIGIARYITDDREGALDEFADAVWTDADRYGPQVISRLQFLGINWQDDLIEIGKRMAKKQGINIDALPEEEREKIIHANDYFQLGNDYFQAGRYKDALEQFEKGKIITTKFSGNFFGVSMVSMQMIELGMIPKEQIPIFLSKAEMNIEECLRLAPNHSDYLLAQNIIREYKNKHHGI
jgi:tetratricopeptide (TPR) repeat protein